MNFHEANSKLVRLVVDVFEFLESLGALAAFRFVYNREMDSSDFVKLSNVADTSFRLFFCCARVRVWKSKVRSSFHLRNVSSRGTLGVNALLRRAKISHDNR